MSRKIIHSTYKFLCIPWGMILTYITAFAQTPPLISHPPSGSLHNIYLALIVLFLSLSFVYQKVVVARARSVRTVVLELVSPHFYWKGKSQSPYIRITTVKHKLFSLLLLPGPSLVRMPHLQATALVIYTAPLQHGCSTAHHSDQHCLCQMSGWRRYLSATLNRPGHAHTLPLKSLVFWTGSPPDSNAETCCILAGAHTRRMMRALSCAQAHQVQNPEKAVKSFLCSKSILRSPPVNIHVNPASPFPTFRLGSHYCVCDLIQFSL